MKKFISIILFFMLTFSIFSSDINVREVAEIVTISGETTVSVTPGGITRIKSQSGSFYLDREQVSKLLLFTTSHLELIDMTGDLDVVYRRSTGRMVARGSKTLSFSFYSPGTGPDDCIMTIRIINYNSYEVEQISFNREQIRELESALNSGRERIQNIQSQISMLNNKVEEIRAIY